MTTLEERRFAFREAEFGLKVSRFACRRKDHNGIRRSWVPFCGSGFRVVRWFSKP